MGNNTLHSIRFPGLSDKYIAPEMAPEFSASTAYAVGDYVTYQGSLYKFTSAHSVGSWNSTEVTLVKLAEEVADLKSAIDGGNITINKSVSWQSGWIDLSGLVKSSSQSGFAVVTLQAGETVVIGTNNTSIGIICSTDTDTVSVGDTVDIIQTTSGTARFEEYSYTATSNINIVLCVRLSDYSLRFEKESSFLTKVNGKFQDTNQVFSYNWESYQFNPTSYTISAGGSITRNIFHSIYLKAGTYHVCCTQIGTLSSVDRNRFYWNKSGETSKTYEEIDRLAEGKHVWKFTVPESTYYDIYVWVYNPSVQFTITDFILYSINVDELNNKIHTLLPSINGFQYGLLPKVSKSGNNLTVTFQDVGNAIAYTDEDGTYQAVKYGTHPSNPITVADGQTLLFDVEADEFVVKGTATFDPTDSKYIYCFVNRGGGMVGPWMHFMDIQRLENALSLNGYVYFRNGGSPNFERSGNDYTITFPAGDTVVYSTPYSTRRTQIWKYASYPSSAISLPSGGLLYYDITGDSFNVVTGGDVSFDLLSNSRILICYNFRGQIVGQWSKYIVQSEIDEISESLANLNLLPSYYLPYIVNKLDAINTQILSMTSGDAFVFITDIHVDGNTMHSPELTKQILDNTPINKVFLNGDYIQQEASKSSALRKINNLISRYNYANNKTFVVVGNHEFNTNGTYQPAPELSWQELDDTLRRRNEDIIIEQSNGLGFIYTDEKKKIKYMVATYNKDSGMDYNSIVFILQNLSNTPNGYTIVFINHGGLNTDGTYQSGFDNLIDCFDAIRNKTTYTFGSTVYDFTSADYTVACAITGHWHQDMYATSSSGMPIISVTTDAQKYDNTGTDRTIGTVNEQAFDVFCIDTTNETINTIRIGAGNNRSFSYSIV